MHAHRSAVVGLLVLGMAVSACSSGGVTQTTGSARGKLPGPPIVIGSIVDLTSPSVGGGVPEVRQAEEAAVTAVNAGGGIDGRPLELQVCDSQFSPNQTETCARQLAGNAKVVAVVGSVTDAGTPAPVLQSARLADFAPFPLTPTDDQDSVSFPLFSELSGEQCAATIALRFEKPKVTSVGWTYLDTPGSAAQLPGIKSAVSQLGADLHDVVPVSPSTSDFSPVVAAATSGATAVGLVLTPAEDEQFIESARQSGYSGGIGAVALDSELIRTLGASADGIYECSPFRPPTDAFVGGREFLQQTHAIKGFVTGIDSENGWIGVHVLADAMTGLSTISRSTVLAKLSSLTGASTYGFTPPYTATVPWKGDEGAAPRLMARTQWYTQNEGGSLELLQATPGRY